MLYHHRACNEEDLSKANNTQPKGLIRRAGNLMLVAESSLG